MFKWLIEDDDAIWNGANSMEDEGKVVSMNIISMNMLAGARYYL